MKDLNQITQDEVLAKGGEVLFDWWLEQVGNTIIWTMKAFVNGKSIKLEVCDRGFGEKLTIE